MGHTSFGPQAPWLEVNPGSHEGGQAASGKQQAQKRFDNEA